MPITAGKIIVPAKELDKYWIAQFQAISGVVGGGAALNVIVIPYNDQGDVGDPIVLDPINIMEQVMVDPDAAQIYAIILAYVQKKGIEQGKIPIEEEEEGEEA